MNKIGIMGGTFNPIHTGHLLLADTARFSCGLDKVIFIPTGAHPFKEGIQRPSDADRLEMVRLATQSNPYFEISDMEIRRQGISYTIDTFRELKKIYPDTFFYFITGADIIMQITLWHEAETLLKELTFVTAYRPGFENAALDQCIESLERDYSADIIKILVPEMDIASSVIRKRVNRTEPVKYLVPEAVENYIYDHQLYV